MTDDSTSLNTCHNFLQQVSDGDSFAWKDFVDLYSPLVYHWCHVAGLPSYEIPDVFQDVFSSVAKSLPNFQHNKRKGSFRAWLRTITKNKIVDHYRRKGKQPSPEGGTEAQDRMLQIAISMESDDGRRTNQSAKEWLLSEKDLTFEILFLNVIPKVQSHFKTQTWKAFWLVVVEGRTPAEVGSELGISPTTVRVAKSRVLCRIRKELGESGV